MSDAEQFLSQTIDLAGENVRSGGQQFGAVVVKNGAVIATGVNETAATHDPTAHAELVAVRAASRELGSPRLDGCTVMRTAIPARCALLGFAASRKRVGIAV